MARRTRATPAIPHRRELWYLPRRRMTLAVVVNDEGWPVEDTAAELMYTAVEREAQ